MQHRFGLAATDPKARPPVAFACLWRRCRGEIKGAPVGPHLFAIVTTRPSALVTRVHPDRMPVFAVVGEHAAWLSGTPDAAASLMCPLPEERVCLAGQGAGLTADRV